MLKAILALLVSYNVFAILILDIEVTHEKGLDAKMILKSELMSKEIAYNGKEVSLQMKNGIHVKLVANFDDESDEFGPSSAFKITGEVRNILSGKGINKTFSLAPKINELSTVSFETGEGQKTTIQIIPKLK
ncbi:hypothetical protein [Bacteriovorax sp. Seq25_V]|uniref:hypothetical protein n=1 Tax=Bacteriovorax sp. Seq25_V TaxID=1201288 RepID=UPI000389FE48|nr:hypothetical protein [Bacteriovorax sp. Seq25_V]EQC47380.1 hypothetical protein M900_0490 [Bacteriovorax sp. Seq25_V]